MTEKEINYQWLRIKDEMREVYEQSGSQGLNAWMNKNNVGSLSLTDIGYVLNITRERVRQIESTALKKLTHPSVGRILKKYIDEGVFSDYEENPMGGTVK